MPDAPYWNIESETLINPNYRKVIYTDSNIQIVLMNLQPDEDIPKDEVLIGAKVTLKDLDSQEVLEYTLVSETEADYAVGKISITSPVGASLLNHKEKETVEIKVPAGILKYQILKITR